MAKALVLLANCRFRVTGIGLGCSAQVASPLQGEGEGEGLPTRQLNEMDVLETPHLSPLPLPQGRGEKA